VYSGFRDSISGQSNGRAPPLPAEASMAPQSSNVFDSRTSVGCGEKINQAFYRRARRAQRSNWRTNSSALSASSCERIGWAKSSAGHSDEGSAQRDHVMNRDRGGWPSGCKREQGSCVSLRLHHFRQLVGSQTPHSNRALSRFMTPFRRFDPFQALAFQFKQLESEIHAAEIAMRRSNLSVYCPDRAIINGVAAPWHPGHLLSL